MAGRIAEELIFGAEKVTSGASSDIQMATNMAKAMVMKFGMSSKLGPLAYGENEQEVFLGHSVTKTQNVSEVVQSKIDEEVKQFVQQGYKTAEKILRNKIKDLHIIAEALLKFETLSGQEMIELLKKKNVNTPASKNSKIEKSVKPKAKPKAGKRKLEKIEPQGI